MNITLNKKVAIFPFLIIALLFCASILFIRSSFFLAQPDSMGLLITLDLLVTIPLVYLFFIRNTRIPSTTVIPVMLTGMLLGFQFMPEDQLVYVKVFRSYVLPLMEISVLAFLFIKIGKTIQIFKRESSHAEDFYSVLKRTCEEMLPKVLVVPFSTEISVIYYGFIKWRTKELLPGEFSYHRKSGTPALLVGLMFVIGAEAFAMHFVLALWSTIAAWILTFISIYSLLQFFGFMKSLAMRPISLLEDRVVLRYGIMGEATILYKDLGSLEKSRKSVREREGAEKLSPLGDLDTHNLLLHLNKDGEKEGLYGIKKKFRTLAIHVDDVDRFIEAISKKAK